MRAFSIFAYRNYRSYLAEWVKNQKNSHGLITKLSDLARCQRSHISRVLKAQLHLTMDQAFRLHRYLCKNEAEGNYFLKLVEYERADDPGYRTKLERELEEIVQLQENLTGRLQRPALGSQEKNILYYSAWHWSAIHIIVSIPQFQTIKAIANRLQIPEKEVGIYLKTLENFGLVKQNGENWIFNSESLHLPKTSPLNSMQHFHWRSRAVLKSQSPVDDGVHFTIVQSISQSDFQIIKQLILKTIDDYTNIATPSKEEELICLTCDFFRV